MRLASLLLVVLIAGTVRAGTIYEVTAQSGTETVTYQVKFGGGKAFSQYTAFDPKAKKFVYRTWKRDEDKPNPVGTIWDHRSGETIELYKFPDIEQPLPIIPSIKERRAR
jgi:hypothetical protein